LLLAAILLRLAPLPASSFSASLLNRFSRSSFFRIRSTSFDPLVSPNLYASIASSPSSKPSNASSSSSSSSSPSAASSAVMPFFMSFLLRKMRCTPPAESSMPCQR